MGTRSLTKVIDNDRPIACMYRQMDGSMDGHGRDLFEFLKDISVVNGMSLAEKRIIANGMDCLAAQLIAHFKDGAGGIYLQHPDTEDVGEEYIYEIEDVNGEIIVTVTDTYEKKEIFKGTPWEMFVKI